MTEQEIILHLLRQRIEESLLPQLPIAAPAHSVDPAIFVSVAVADSDLVHVIQRRKAFEELWHALQDGIRVTAGAEVATQKEQRPDSSSDGFCWTVGQWCPEYAGYTLTLYCAAKE